MEQVLKHYGSAILAVIVLLALGAILVAALTSDGYVASAFRDALEGFFSDMSALTPGNVPTPAPQTTPQHLRQALPAGVTVKEDLPL